MLHLLVRYGGIAVLLGAALEGDATVILAGVVAHMGLLELPYVIVMAFLGGVLGDWLWFAVGRIGGVALRRRPHYARVAALIERLAARIGVWEIVAARFVYGTRLASMVFWGVHGLSFPRFVVVDAIGCALWAVAFVGLGYGLSESATVFLGRVRRSERWLAGGVLAAVAVVLLLRAIGRRVRPAMVPPPRRD